MHGFLLLGGLLLHSCSGETQLDGESEVPDGKDPARQEILLNINNKLVLHKTDTRTIATAGENAISTLDVYVFGSPTEDGTYTFQERFAYRENSDDLPADAKELVLNAGATDNVTTGLLSLHRGLFVKFYCIANDTQPVKADGDEVVADDFTPITFTAGSSTMERAGSPTEADFIQYHTRLLDTDVLNVPLAMAGAQTLPLDLTDASTSTRQQVNFKLTRLAARFDVVNKADESRFTIESISMLNARRAAGYFPIVACGTYPAADADLMTTADKPFTGDNANIGTQTGAFYCYPSLQEDGGALLLKGRYKVNETETKEVSYRIPFRQQGIDGQETYLDINNNHRYTIGITEADDLRLEFTLRVADWTDDGSIDDYEPDNDPGEITVTIPDAFQGRSTATLDPDRNVYTVSMSLDAGSSFDMTVGSASPGIKIVYAGGPSAQSNNWLTCIKNTSTGLASGSSYTFKVTDGYSKLFPRATVRVYDVLSGTENILYVDAVSVPQPLATMQPAKAPNGESDNPNTFDAGSATVTLYRITGSSADVSFVCPDEMVLVGKPGWMDVSEPVKNGTKYTYTLTLNDRDVELTTTTAAGTRASVAETTDNTVVFANSKNTSTLKVPITITLKDAPMRLDFAALGGSNNSYTEPSGDTPGKITMSVANGNTCLVPAVSMDGVEVVFDFGGNTEWLTSTVTTTDTSAGSKQQNVKFQLVSDKLAGAKDVTVTLKNKIGGADRKFTISPNVGSLSFSGNSSWGVDVLNTGGKTMTLYKVASGNSEKMKITVNSWGGSKVESSNTGIVKVSGSAEQSVDAATYQLVTTGFGTATLTFTNRVDPTKNVTYNVTVNSFSAPTLNSSSVTLKSVPRNEGSSNLSATVTVTSPVGGYEVSSGTNSSIASYSMSGNNCTVKAVKAGSTSITFRNKLDASKTAAYNVSVTGILYEGEPVWKYYGLYIAPRNAASNMQWNSSLNNSYCANKEGGTWHVPSRDEWRTILGNSDSATESVWKEYLNKRIFANEYYWSTTDAGSGKAYAMFRLMAGEMSVDVLEKNYLSGAVRCIAR
ncbi:hypothetical protein DWX97_07360 [Bacteroides cellulosilyticus]|uniref:Major fimbrial subunit protein N-terminal domain-containing protein n=2 Tax=Bacteroides cellulosilyticus TaxID=246787 RepID=A0A412IKM9_9BACE|nr:hypothetical protein DWX97_07360 [Bacteroides cellulosilyticus]